MSDARTRAPLTRAARQAAGLLGLPALLAGVLHLALAAPATKGWDRPDSGVLRQEISAADPLSPFPAAADGADMPRAAVPARLECRLATAPGIGTRGACLLWPAPRRDI